MPSAEAASSGPVRNPDMAEGLKSLSDFIRENHCTLLSSTQSNKCAPKISLGYSLLQHTLQESVVMIHLPLDRAKRFHHHKFSLCGDDDWDMCGWYEDQSQFAAFAALSLAMPMHTCLSSLSVVHAAFVWTGGNQVVEPAIASIVRV